ncbi:conserved hypothetical protein [Pyrobaculum islandicum DSM 4184]|uniref:Uncharacterized protein n=1 Tax=Pyrobaculum islandicum (strain DSM 4184 / JCM 9189 / GEO3) TaxID=384616 RepID=A1RQG0_PYRIL|nr:hypothetical protein [Pyrobaculum islandicum]ABL87192.1 conserved hypothetical protein [Pyrobaculum islandicum DSM 4184]
MSFEKNLLERIASYIPGYAGYKEKEVRRETDALVRRHVASILSAAAAQLTLGPAEARAVAANPEARFLWDSVKAALDRVTQKIDKAQHGYSGFFDLAKVDESVLEEVYRHDLTLVETAKKVAETVSSLKALRPLSQEWLDALRQILAQLQSLDSAVDERNRILDAIKTPPQPQWESGGRKRGLLDRLFKRT